MNYDKKFAHLNPGDTDEVWMKSDKKCPCIVCGKFTDIIDICYDGYICSDDCQKKQDYKWGSRFYGELLGTDK